MLESEFNEYQTAISPDGRWLAYGSNETGQREVYVRSFPGGESKWQLSNGGGADPTWTKEKAAEEMANAIDAYVRSAEVIGVATDVVDLGSNPIGTGAQAGVGSLN